MCIVISVCDVVRVQERNPKVLFVRRDDYVRTPYMPLQLDQRLANEPEVANAIQRWMQGRSVGDGVYATADLLNGGDGGQGDATAPCGERRCRLSLVRCSEVGVPRRPVRLSTHARAADTSPGCVHHHRRTRVRGLGWSVSSFWVAYLGPCVSTPLCRGHAPPCTL